MPFCVHSANLDAIGHGPALVRQAGFRVDNAPIGLLVSAHLSYLAPIFSRSTPSFDLDVGDARSQEQQIGF
ncbi:hypothetical protein EW146_g8866 [Bondarzewia mesenterica]|uniref:Uncharacterized protein n=1 Tax=Bondarzewia mesenterica TaxID=1095465 RepID=A0A4V3XD95_9AGAM|nr:hypothetical protein EW146_g8866 [Bondarzewia mesenterica]